MTDTVFQIDPGTRVLIARDCRDENTATGQYGIYEGHFPYGDDPEKFKNPRIRLEDGSVIWGIECWWIPVSEIMGPGEVAL